MKKKTVSVGRAPAWRTRSGREQFQQRYMLIRNTLDWSEVLPEYSKLCMLFSLPREWWSAQQDFLILM